MRLILYVAHMGAGEILTFTSICLARRGIGGDSGQQRLVFTLLKSGPVRLVEIRSM